MMYAYLLLTCVAVCIQVTFSHYTSQWVAHIDGGKEVADQVATDHGFENLGEIFQDYYHFAHKTIVKRSLTPHVGKKIALAADTRVRWAQQQVAKRRTKRDYKLQDSDPRWPAMWYLNRGNGLDMNVIPAWLEGVTGKGAVVTILDDGLEKDHPDLVQNYDPLASYDVNNQDSDPSPRYDMIDSNRHGTRCAGEVAATSNNSVCALGVAHGAQVGGVRMLDGDVTDAVEARSLSLNPQHIDIYSASWGPDDDGKTVDGPGELATRAFIEGVTKGRNGKGSIFVWASGNGGREHDNCNCDGYTNSIYSLSISSATEKGHVPWYSEACSSTLASTYSSGAVGEKQVVTTDLHHSCTSSHTGTSASAPLAAGICALALEANPNLTWRDMQHIVIRTARPQRLLAPDWQTNGVGRNVSHSFGYGLMDAHAMVQLARKWITVPEQYKCEISAPHAEKAIPAKSVVVLKLTVSKCEGVNILEHVQAKLTIFSQRRGDLNIQLTSPMGTRVTLLAHRVQDLSRAGFSHWPFMSVHSWGESPFGTWQLEIHNDGRLLGRATLQSWSLVLYGTKQSNPNDLDSIKTNKIKNGPSAKKKNGKKQKSKGGQKSTTVPPKVPKAPNKSKAKNLNVTAPKYFVPISKNKKNMKPPPDISSFFYAVNNSKFNKLVKNITITYPIMIPAREFDKNRGEFRKLQKQKEKSRDINSNRKIFTPRPTVVPSADLLVTVAKDKSTADIKGWDMIFYGTTTPPAIDGKGDSVHNTDSYDFHNSIDTNSPSDAWKTESGIRKDTSTVEEFIPETNSLNGCQVTKGNSCIVCMATLFLLDGTCVSECPETFYPKKYLGSQTTEEPVSINYCDPCHYTCKHCRGYNDYECSECHPDASLFEGSNNESYCYPKVLTEHLFDEIWCYRVFVFLLIVAVSISVAAVTYCARTRTVKRHFETSLKSIKTNRGADDRTFKSAVDSDSE